MENVPNTDMMSEDDVLAFTRSKRMALANKLTETGIPTEKDSATILLHTLDGLDRSSLTRLKIKAEEKANKNNSIAAAAIAEILSKVSNNAYQMPGISRRDIPVLPASISDPEIVDGELETNPEQLDYNTFTSQFDGDES